MKYNRYKVLSIAIAVGLASSVATATVSKDLAYPSGNLSANDVANQNYFVNHFYSFGNYAITKKGKDITALILRAKGSNPLTLTLERYLNNEPTGAGVNAQDLAIFRSGKLKGTGMLITDFSDANKSQSYEIFIPSIRKVRRFAEPARDDAWGGSDFTFGDVTLRKPKHDIHELLGTTKFAGCLNVMKDVKRNKYTQNAKIVADCSTDGKEVYKLKSTSTDANWWYDNRVSYIDTKTFADYRTEYFKGGNKVKVIDRSWVSAGLSDPRASYWGYWYGKTLATGHETMAFIPSNITKVNHKYKKKNLWSTRTLKKMPKKIK
ncbi:MAG: outer membrane lipoprotein-sorting protein [Candidatus Thioglobus sp.]|nr:MAG: outer membrane lipoprotein-sorting protein [Candidatus Thioglobus sp.]